MKVHVLLFGAGLLLGATAMAQGQVMVSVGSGLAYDCFLYAKSGANPGQGVGVCDGALRHETLTRKNRAATYDNRGVILDRLGRTEQARADFHQAITLDPALGDPYVNLGSMLIKQGQHQAALDQINKGLELGMSYPHIGYYDRAVAQQLLGRYREAYYDYKKVLELEPNFTQAADRLKDFTVTRAPAPKPG